MRTGPKLKGKAVAATQGKSRNQPDTLGVHSKGKKLEHAGGARSGNHPNVAPTPKAEIGKALPNSYFANSRTAVHKNFDRHPHD